MKYLFAVVTALVLTTLIWTGLASAHEVKVGDLLIEDLWSRATAKGAPVGVGYMKITNKGTAPDRLVSASSPASAKVEVHEMAMANGVMKMRPVKNLEIAPGKSVVLAPSGFHLMFVGLKEQLKEGGKLPLTLVFEKAGKTETFLHVQGIGSQQFGAPGGQMDHSGHGDHKM